MAAVLRGIAGCVFSLESTDGDGDHLVKALYGAADVTHGVPRARFTVGHRDGRWALAKDGARLCQRRSAAAFFAATERRLTEEYMDQLDHFLQFHAGSVVAQGQGILLAGRPQAGKTSLVWALALAGAAIGGDEIALLHPRDLRLHAFPRDLVVHEGTLGLLGQTLGQEQPAPWTRFDGGRYLAPHRVGSLAAPAPVGRLVLPRYCPGQAARLKPLGPAAAARRLLAETFNMERWKGAGVDILARLVEAAPACELIFGDARRGADLLLAGDLLAGDA